jgi:hypothetical protein
LTEKATEQTVTKVLALGGAIWEKKIPK